MKTLQKEFLKYLLELEHSKKTAIDYVSRVNQVFKEENLKNLKDIQSELYGVIVKYHKKNKRCLLPLKKLNGFFLERSFLGDSTFNTNMMNMITRTIDPNTGKLKLSNDNGRDFLVPKELADYLQVDERTLKRWRQKREGPDWEKIGGKIHYPLVYIEKYLEEQKNK